MLGNRAGFAAKFAEDMQNVANSTESGSDWDSQSVASDASDEVKQPYVALATPCTPWLDPAPRGVFSVNREVPAQKNFAFSQRNVARQPAPKYEYQEAPSEYISRPQPEEYGYAPQEYNQTPSMVPMQMQMQQQMQEQMQQQQMQMMRQMQQQMQQQWMNSMPSMVIPVPVPVPATALKPPQVQVPFGYQLVRQEKPMLEDLLPGQTRGVRRRRNTRPRRTDQAGGSSAAKVFVGGLSPHSTADTLREHFEKFGVISDCAVITEPGTRKSRGFGFVEFADGIPAGLLDQEHIVGQRRCGVRCYDYAAKVESEECEEA